MDVIHLFTQSRYGTVDFSWSGNLIVVVVVCVVDVAEDIADIPGLHIGPPGLTL